MEVNSFSIKNVFGVLILLFSILVVSPQIILAASYGAGTYGSGNYNDGETTTTSDGSSSSNNSSSTSTSGCGSSASTGVPDLFEIHTTKNSATLYFAPPSMPYSNFYIAYSRKTDSWEYGTQFNQGNSPGAVTYTINALQSNTNYYFKVRPGNGCAAGNWGNTMRATTTSSKQTRTYYKSFITAVVQQMKNFVSNVFPPSNPKPITPPKVNIEPGSQTQPQKKPAATPKAKFCILWWCF
jgi:hypothetical protein